MVCYNDNKKNNCRYFYEAGFVQIVFSLRALFLKIHALRGRVPVSLVPIAFQNYFRSLKKIPNEALKV